MADTTITQSVGCTRLANLLLAPSVEANDFAVNAQMHIATPINARAESAASGDEGSSAPADSEPVSQPSTSTQNSPQADGPAPAPPVPLPDASPTVGSVSAQKRIAKAIDARADAVRPAEEARASDTGETTAQSDENAWRDASPTVAVPRWGVWLAANLSKSKAWALYRERLRLFASLIGDREPIVLQSQLPGMGSAKRYIIAIADDDRAPLDIFCEKLTAAGSICDVMRNEFGP
jgi:hypothetical protein